jgi:hypothetical protein
MSTIGQIRVKYDGTQRTRNHARAELLAGFSTVGAAWTLKP